jgi:Domain of unknown function (DUF4279)
VPDDVGRQLSVGRLTAVAVAREMAGACQPPQRTLAGVETLATFRLFGDATLTAAAVTRRLSIQPTHALEAGDQVGHRTASTRETSAWLLGSAARPEDGTELAAQLHRLLTVLEPVTTHLWDLARAGYEANWFCYIASHVTEHAAELDRQTMQRLLALPGDLWLDVCGDSLDEEEID